MKLHKPSMLVVLSGGLGNQLFQYATARAIELRTGANLALDSVTGFQGDRVYQRSYELDALPGPCDTAKAPGISPRAWLWMRLRGRPGNRALSQALRVVDERLKPEAPLASEGWLKEGLILSGYWQDERFFQGYREQLIHELRPGGLVQRKTEEVAVHVRKVQYTRGVGIEYFENAMKQMRKRIARPRFALFTDDLEWGVDFAAQHADMDVVGKGGSAIDDFRALCGFRHFIISNSTFSWWAAWLSEQGDSLIISPGPEWWSNSRTPPTRWTTIGGVEG